MQNVLLALQILMDLLATAKQVSSVIKQANESGVDITQEQINSIIADRDAVLNQLKQIAGV